MNENNTSDKNVEVYKASANNLNTIISNPTVNINDTMNMNIKTMNSADNYQPNQNIQPTNNVNQTNVTNNPQTNITVSYTHLTLPTT